jgi:hypothetical protein
MKDMLLCTAGGISFSVPVGPIHCRNSSMTIEPPNTAATRAATSPKRVQ